MKEVIEIEKVVFGGGCFWCTEAIFLNLRGVLSARPGYAGGNVPNPTYEQVSTGKSGHAEAVEIKYDSVKIKFLDLLAVFFGTHDPTTKNRQGNDTGTQYRSIIFYTNLEQKKDAEEFIFKLKKEDGLNIVTEVEKLTKFYPAEDYHEKYYEKHKDAPYCQIVIDPKLKKLRDNFQKLLK